jgi:hypothetical protein
MKKEIILTLLVLIASFTTYALHISPSSGGICIGSSITLHDTATTGGIWTSSSPAIATIGSSSGVMTGVSAGVVTMTYTLGSSYATGTYTVSPTPAAISGGGTTICAGATVSLSDATPGGTWSCPSYATVGTTGVVTGTSAGVATIYYSISGCYVSTNITVNATPAGMVAGPYIVCAGSTVTLWDSLGGTGTWSSSSPGIAAIGSASGIVTGVSVGTATITLTTTGICGPVIDTRVITVSSTTSPGTISGTSGIAMGASTTLSETVWGGTWSSSAAGVATVGSVSGIVSGVSVGSATITYTVIGCGGTANATASISVTPFNGISGYVHFSGSMVRPDSVRVYLITYDPVLLDLQAADSITYQCNDTLVYYQFPGLSTDSFRVKAAGRDTSHFTTGYIPTYHTSSFYWYSANVINHVSGTADINENIVMAYGAVTSGPGFIGGSVLTGANKGTSGGTPVVGLKMVILNATTNQVLQSVRTDASGNYSFSSLPVGQTYYVFPDSLNYHTTPYTGITLTSTAASVTNAGFIQHTISKTITPILTGTKNLNPSASSVIAFPNPTNGNLNIQWTEKTNETATVTIADVTGRTLMSNTINMNQGIGTKQLDLSILASGTYLISVKSASLDYTNKVQVTH